MCSRITYLGPDDIVMTGRSLDWTVPMQTSFYVLPAGLEQHGAAGPDSLTWTSQYGSLVIAGYDGATIDGLNEHGLLVNKLYLAEADYGSPATGNTRPPISVVAWGQYVLDHYRNVDEVVEGMRAEPFRIVPLITPDGNPAVVHMSVTRSCISTSMPCSPDKPQPTLTQSRRISASKASARSNSPSFMVSYMISGCRLPSPA